MLTTIFALLFYLAGLIMAAGLVAKIALYAKTPAPLKIPVTPAPTTRGGVVLRMAREVVFFQSLFNSNKWTWAFGWIFHVSLAVVLFRHLRYFLQPVPEIVAIMQPIGVLAGFAMVAGLLLLWARRFLVERVRYITGPSDHLMLALLAAIGFSGLAMKFVAHTDIVSLKAFILGLMYFDWQPLPPDPVLIVHLSLVLTLMIVFPFSKLLHVPGVFFAPSRNQVDDSRERRYAPRGLLKPNANKA